MSGIEAVVGTVASGAGLVSLALQLGESAIKLRRLIVAARNAPHTLYIIASDLETMTHALQQLEQHRQFDSHGVVLLSRCIGRCQEQTTEIKKLVEKFERAIAKRNHAGKMYTAMKEKEVKELLQDLERAKSSLELAYMMYLASEQQRRDQAITDTLLLQQSLLDGIRAQVSSGDTRLSNQLNLLLQSSAASQQSQLSAFPTQATRSDDSKILSQDLRSPSKQVKRRKSKPLLSVNLRLPLRLSSRIWNFAVHSSQSRWSMYLRTYHFVPYNSLIFHYCKLGDLTGIRNLVKSGKGSLLDVKSHPRLPDETLLQVRYLCCKLVHV